MLQTKIYVTKDCIKTTVHKTVKGKREGDDKMKYMIFLGILPGCLAYPASIRAAITCETYADCVAHGLYGGCDERTDTCMMP